MDKELSKSTILRQYGRPDHKHGYRIEPGDIIKVWWDTKTPKTVIKVNKITSACYEGPDNAINCIFEDGRGLTIQNYEVVHIAGRNEKWEELLKNWENKDNKDNKDAEKKTKLELKTEPKTETDKPKKSRKNKKNKVFTCKGIHLKVGDIMACGWKADGDKIITLHPYIGLLSQCFPYGAQEATFLEHKEPLPLDNSKDFVVFHRTKPQGISEVQIVDDDGHNTKYTNLTEEEELELERELISESNKDFDKELEDDYNKNVYDEKECDRECGFHTGMKKTPVKAEVKIEVTVFEA